MNDVVGEDNSSPLALVDVRVDRAVHWRLDSRMRKKLNKFEVRILELLREGQIENPTSTVVFTPTSTKQRGATRLLAQRKLVSPIGTLNKTKVEVTLTRTGLYHLQRLRAKAKENQS